MLRHSQTLTFDVNKLCLLYGHSASSVYLFFHHNYKYKEAFNFKVADVRCWTRGKM